MNIVIAMDSFKGSLSSVEAGNAVAEGIRSVMPSADICVCPLADGGEGTVDAVHSSVGGEYVICNVTAPLGDKVDARYLVFDGKAVIEIASASGLTLVDEDKRDVLHSSTFGVGELIKDALLRGVREFYIGLGGSATNDCGIGMLKALGYRFLDASGNEADLCNVTTIDQRFAVSELKQSRFHVMSDVDNPLYGLEGASFVFAPQKGATADDVVLMDGWIRRFAELTGRLISDTDPDLPGNGAAGGLGYALRAYLGADVMSGADAIIEMSGLEKLIRDADIVVTGEGKIDRQTLMGKGPSKVALLSKRYGKRVIGFAGIVEDCELSSLFDEVIEVVRHEPGNPMDSTVAAHNIMHTAKYRFISIN